MSLAFFSTLLGVSAEIIAFVVAFYGAYLVYLRQQRDKYREELTKDFQKLDLTISQWSVLEDYTRPISWHPPMGKYFQILTEHSWKKSPLEILKDSLNELDNVFGETQKEERKFREHTGGRLVAGSALYMKVRFAFRDFVQLIYAQFPRPPGDYEISPPPGEIPFNVKSFVRHDFPNNREVFLTWAKLYDIFFEGLYKIYYRIRPIIDTLKKIEKESLEQTEKSIIELEKQEKFAWAADHLKEIKGYSMAEINYYEQAFDFLGTMKHKINIIRDKIRTYDNYFYKGKRRTVLSFIAMVITGVIIPFIILFFTPDWPLQIMELISGLGFGLSTLSAILLIYGDISKF